MSPLSGPVLCGAAIMASPALYAGLVEGTMPIDVSLTRYLIAVVVCWGLLSLLVELALPSGASMASARAQADAGDQEEITSGRSAGGGSAAGSAAGSGTGSDTGSGTGSS